ncbi:MAG: DF family (seleno)protein [Solirubrobacterales bacterium]
MIELLFWEGCPSHPRALAELTRLLDAFKIDRDQLRLIEVRTDADARRERFIGSPTIRLNGEDLVDTGDTAYALDCRIYFRRDGKVSPLPDPADLRDAIAQYAATEKGF